MRLYGWYKKEDDRDKRRVRNFEVPQPDEVLYKIAMTLFEKRTGKSPNTIGVRQEDKRDWMRNVKIMKPPRGHFFLWIETKKSNS